MSRILRNEFLKGSYRKYFGWIWNEYLRTWKKRERIISIGLSLLVLAEGFKKGHIENILKESGKNIREPPPRFSPRAFLNS